MFKSTGQGEGEAGAWAKLRLNDEDNFLVRLLTWLMSLRGCSEHNSAHLRNAESCYQERLRYL